VKTVIVIGLCLLLAMAAGAALGVAFGANPYIVAMICGGFYVLEETWMAKRRDG
jgi:hypothetical protein